MHIDKFFIVIITMLITGCGNSGMPSNINLTCNDLLGFPENDIGRDYPIVSHLGIDPAPKSTSLT